MGLGHIARDLAIMRAVRKRTPEVQITWLTAQPNITVLEEAGESLHPISYSMQSQSEFAEKLTQAEFRYDSKRGFKLARTVQRHNAKLLAKVLEGSQPDLVFGDESLEILWVMAKHPELKQWPLILLTDALYPVLAEPPRSWNPLRIWNAYTQRRKYVQYMRTFKDSGFKPYLMLYVGMEEEIPDKSMGFGLPKLRSFFHEYFEAIGYTVPFDVKTLLNEGKSALKSRLGYSADKKLIVVSAGGSGIGGELLERVDTAATELADVVGGTLEIALFCGPRLAPESVQVTSDLVTVHGYVPRLYEHFAAADFAVIKAGLGSAVELAALGTPFVYVPAQGYVEEESEVVPRLQRLGVGTGLSFGEATPRNLARIFEGAIRHPPVETTDRLRLDGAEVAAEHILRLLPKKQMVSLSS